MADPHGRWHWRALGLTMADREQDALRCSALRREREASPPSPASLHRCRCDHDHPPEVSWCDLCEYLVERA